MNETNSHLPPVQGGNGLFVPITLEEMAKSPEIFGRAGAVCSEVAETPPVVPQELQNAVTEPKVQRLNCANASEIFYLVVNTLNQQKPLWRYQNHFYMKENNVYVPYNKKVFICRVYFDVTALGYEFTQPAICSITNELEMRADLYQGEPNDERYTYCSNGFLNNRTLFLITFRPFSLPGRIWDLARSIILTWTVSCQLCLLEIRRLKREHTRSLATVSAVTLMRNAFLFSLVLLEITVNLPLST